jgi:hypothetical protein
MYDRMCSLGRHAERPVKAGGPLIPVRQHVHGKPLYLAGVRQPGRKGRNRQP